MQNSKIANYIEDVLESMPVGWLSTTTHRLDIYNEKLAKTQFLEQLEILYNNNTAEPEFLNQLPTAYDYIRLGHPLSCLLDWGIAQLQHQKAENVISFSSITVPVLAILRKNLLENKNTQICYIDELPTIFNADELKNVYGYNFELKQVKKLNKISEFEGSTIFISQQEDICDFRLTSNVDFFINIHPHIGSILVINGEQNDSYISDIQHVRRRETIE